MGRKNRRMNSRELSKDVIRSILADNKPEIHVYKGVNHEDGMKAEAVIIDDPATPSAADRQYHHARQTCDRIVDELEKELRRMDHVRSR